MSTEIKQFDVIDAAIAKLTIDYDHLPECSTDEGLQQAKDDYKVIRRFEIDLEEARNKLLVSARAKIKTINAEAGGIDTRLKKISSPFKSAIDIRKAEIKEEEEKRIADIKAEIFNIQAFVNQAIGKSSQEISNIIESVDNIEIGEHFKELHFEASETLNSTKAKLSEMLTFKIQTEINEKKAAEEQAEKDRVQAENDKLLREQEEAKTAVVRRNTNLIKEKMMGFEYLINDVNDLVHMDTYDLSVILDQRIKDEQARLQQIEDDKEAEAIERGKVQQDAAEKRQTETTINMDNGSSIKVHEGGESLTGVVVDDIPFTDDEAVENIPFAIADDENEIVTIKVYSTQLKSDIAELIHKHGISLEFSQELSELLKSHYII